MSRPWNPNRQRWLSAEAYAALSPADKKALWIDRKARRAGRRLPPGAKAGLVLVGAAFLGVGIAAYQVLGPRDIVADELALPAPQRADTVASAPVMDPADREWAERARSGLPRSARNDRAGAVRASFAYCKWGGGTNCVVDGDTFWIGGRKVRIAGIDAPETHDYRCQSELDLGERAARQLQALLNSGAVTMTSINRDHDTYGRLLRNVSVNGQDVGEGMITAGVARAYAGGRRPWC